MTPWLERQLLGLGEELVKISPKLTVPERRAGRVRGKSDPIDALAVARAALREPDLQRPQPGEQVHRTIKLRLDRGGNRQLNAALYRIAMQHWPSRRALLQNTPLTTKKRRTTWPV